MDFARGQTISSLADSLLERLTAADGTSTMVSGHALGAARTGASMGPAAAADATSSHGAARASGAARRRSIESHRSSRRELILQAAILQAPAAPRQLPLHEGGHLPVHEGGQLPVHERGACAHHAAPMAVSSTVAEAEALRRAQLAAAGQAAAHTAMNAPRRAANAFLLRLNWCECIWLPVHWRVPLVPKPIEVQVGPLLVDRLLEVHAFSLFFAGAFNADPHAGNVLLDEATGEITLIDVRFVKTSRARALSGHT